MVISGREIKYMVNLLYIHIFKENREKNMVKSTVLPHKLFNIFQKGCRWRRENGNNKSIVKFYLIEKKR